jgi:AcrR family transcriptional regulator
MEPLDKILGAATDLFLQYGFKAITMDDIARRAGISKKTLYQHFANKHEVVTESVIWQKCNMTDTIEASLQNSENALEYMVRMMLCMDQVYKKINPVIMFELQRFFPEAYKTFRDQLETKDVDMMRKSIEQGMEEGLFRKEINADLMARYRLETSLMALQPNLMVNDRNDLMSVGMEIGEHFLYGIMTHKGEELYQKYKEQYLKKASKI